MTYVITPFNNEYILYSKSNEGVCDWYRNTKIFYLDIFKNHPYIFNLGHGILPETNPNMVEYLIKTVKDY